MTHPIKGERYELRKDQIRFLNNVLKSTDDAITQHTREFISDTLQLGYYYENDSDLLNIINKYYSEYK